ncbi:hypothetical protein EJ05DRAFT_48234 [Pseudovirgaria hyperparasitica]|uniref:Uncharacterized protein n=1 Tax=Pseudovirgaria hyperparasitica TaxID=470096 RepID=A0A6A6W2W2_9PEZI|nr:uncharacterized protein EJ05DRAFT_48234 [Pseudovirgaria hyperparasitica]KAF2756933.1 hypothetical protein EJ05DRAFT_48234 [Pseudovirgaria hyperparasitica]
MHLWVSPQTIAVKPEPSSCRHHVRDPAVASHSFIHPSILLMHRTTYKYYCRSSLLPLFRPYSPTYCEYAAPRDMNDAYVEPRSSKQGPSTGQPGNSLQNAYRVATEDLRTPCQASPPCRQGGTRSNDIPYQKHASYFFAFHGGSTTGPALS